MAKQLTTERLTKRDSRATEAQLRAAGVGEPAIALYLGDAEDVAAPPTKPSRTFGRIRPSPAGQWKIELPWSCLVSDNHRHSLIASHGKAYKAAREKARELARAQWGDASVFTGRVSVGLAFTPPRLGRPDPVNLLKCLLDALSGVCYADDVQIYRLAVERRSPDIDRPHVTITVEEIAP